MEQNQPFQLLDIILLESTFKRIVVVSPLSQEFEQKNNLVIEHDISVDMLAVFLTVEHSLIMKGVEEVTTFTKMVAVFNNPKNPNIPLDVFINVNAPAVIFPFIREHLASISAKAGLYPILLPLVNFVKRAEDNK